MECFGGLEKVLEIITDSQFNNYQGIVQKIVRLI